MTMSARNPDKVMSILGHVMELRRRLIASIFVLLICFILVLVFYDETVRLFIDRFARIETVLGAKLFSNAITEGFLVQIRTSAIVAVMVSLPFHLVNIARAAFEKLRNDGVVRFLGVTAHSSRVLADALEDYPYDCALITLNAAREIMDEPSHLDRFFRVAQEKQVGVIAMKVVARGDLISRGFNIRQLLPYALSHPISTAIIGISNIRVLEENVRAAKEFSPMSEQEMRNLEA
ncbi:MAG: twin-arginine translocase subunit TatC, partial [Treponema sp.]|nr:twin-arginine translocase subunit TatC [Treponema sp.]